jgi:hypothetical protein
MNPQALSDQEDRPSARQLLIEAQSPVELAICAQANVDRRAAVIRSRSQQLRAVRVADFGGQ